MTNNARPSNTEPSIEPSEISGNSITIVSR